MKKPMSQKQKDFLAKKEAVFNGLAEKIENLFLSEIKWEMPFGSIVPNVNHVTGRRYSGLNIMNLWLAKVEGGFTANEWITYKQAQDLGYQILKGSKGVDIEFWFKKEIKSKEDVDTTEKEDKENPSYWSVKYSNVFNIECFTKDGQPILPKHQTEQPFNKDDFTLEFQESECLRFANLTKCEISIVDNFDQAYYSPAEHRVVIASKECFKTEIGYISVLLHELGHSTQKSLRANWEKGLFGSTSYAKEEVVAELSSVFTSSMLGLERVNLESHAGYLKGWLSKAKAEDEHFFKKAIKESIKVAFYFWDTLYPECKEVIVDKEEAKAESVN